jgi:N-acetylglucosamine-6-phosphate deacetylase
MRSYALTAARVFDGEAWHDDAAVLVSGDSVEAVMPRRAVAGDVRLVETNGIIAPGFVDLQVNGGGGVMLNDRQDVETIRTICAAHAPFGTTALLATLITDTPEITARAVDAGAAAAEAGVAGFLGLHLEGPHLSIARKGAHDPRLIRPMTDADEAFLLEARARLPALLTTIAPESVEPARVAALVNGGVVVSLGHSDTTHATARAYAEAGSSMVTHLFNAMSQIGNREPGLAGAGLSSERLWTGLIADGFHVDPATIGIAVRAKQGPARIFLVTDAMATIGTDMTSFTLNGRSIRRSGGRLTLEDGTLAGADLDMISAVRFMHGTVGLNLAEALRMASLYPAQAMGVDDRHGRLGAGTRADIVSLSDDLAVTGVWIGGDRVSPAP